MSLYLTRQCPVTDPHGPHNWKDHFHTIDQGDLPRPEDTIMCCNGYPNPEDSEFITFRRSDFEEHIFQGNGYAQYEVPPQDEHHTMEELYEYRLLYNAAFFNELALHATGNVHKSWRHSDGELCFGGGWFIVVATLAGQQVSNHYRYYDWELFKVAVKDTADEWDGHTPEVAAQRMRDWLKR